MRILRLFVVVALSLLPACQVGTRPKAAPEEVTRRPDLTTSSLQAQEAAQGVVEGVGTSFEVTDSQYVNIRLDSTEAIYLRLASIPNTFTLSLGPVAPEFDETTEYPEEVPAPATTTIITLSNLPPLTTFFLYEDSYEAGPHEFTTDSQGGYTFTQDITEAHLIFIQPKRSTKFINNAETGGDCELIGDWAPSTKTCTLAGNVSETIEISASGVTLDGNGHSLIGSNTGSGVFLANVSSVTVRNLDVQQFSYGVFVSKGLNNRLENLTLQATNTFGVVLSGSTSNTIKNSTFDTTLLSLSVRTESYTYLVPYTYYIRRCIFLSCYYDGPYTGYRSETGYRQYYSTYNKIYRNNFLNTSLSYTVTSSISSNMLSDANNGGNYWSIYDEPREGCYDNDADDVCDAARNFGHLTDDAPWTTFNAWSNQAPMAAAGGPYSGVVGSPVSFDGAGTDPDGTIALYTWDFGDGSSLVNAGATPTHTYTADGTYTVKLTVEDNYGKQASDTASVTIESDTTPPTITPNVVGALGDNDWYTSDVTVTWSVTDDESEITATNGCDATTVNSDTNGMSLTCEATSAGGTASESVTVKRDATAPVVTPSSSYIPGTWTNADVTVNFACDASVSDIASEESSVTLNTEGENQSASSTCTDNAGNSTTATFENIDIDKTPPSITASATTADAQPYTGGWTNQTVTVSFECGDALSGIAGDCPADVVIDADTSADGQDVSASVSDNAGNTSKSNIINVRVDKTPPTVTATASPAANSEGWNNTDVTVSFTGTDTLSGIDTCDPAVVLSTEGEGLSATGTCADLAGNSASATANGINIDKTAPTATASASPAPNANGWNKSSVTVSFSGSDDRSGIASCDNPVVLSGEGAGQSASGTCTDEAGNVSVPAVADGINIDLTDPVVEVTGVSDNATYILGSVPSAGCSTSDALSGVATHASLSVTVGNSNGVGSFTASCDGALDNADNGNSASVYYNVIYDFDGFFQPIENLPVFNRMNAGRAVSVKFSLNGDQGLGILNGAPGSVQITCDASDPVSDVEEETVTAGNSSLSYDASADQYIYVWDTSRSWGGSCRQLIVRLDDDTEHRANFEFR